MHLTDDDCQQPDPERQTLQQALTILMQIRRQRLHRAQRQLRQQQLATEQAQQRHQNEQQQLARWLQAYEQQRAAFQHRQQPLEKLTQHLANEQAALQATERQRQQCVQAQEAHAAAAAQLISVSDQAHAQQKAVEKLEFLSEQLQEAQ